VNICSGRFWITDTAWAQPTDMGTHISVYVYLSQTDSTKGKWGSIEREDLSPFFKARANRYSDREWQDQLKSLCCRIWQGVEELKNRLDLDKYPHHRVYPEFEVVPLILRSTHQPLNLSRSANRAHVAPSLPQPVSPVNDADMDHFENPETDDAAAEEERVKREALIAESKRLEQKYQETQARIRQREQDNERLAKKLAEMKAENDAWDIIWDTTAARLGITNATVARKEAKLIQLVKMVDALANHIVDFDNDDEVQGGDVQGSEVQGGDAQGDEVQGGDAQGDEVQGGGAPEAGGQ
jgi:hypothetical protein